MKGKAQERAILALNLNGGNSGDGIPEGGGGGGKNPDSGTSGGCLGPGGKPGWTKLLRGGP
jgi:hypothetical protein